MSLIPDAVQYEVAPSEPLVVRVIDARHSSARVAVAYSPAVARWLVMLLNRYGRDAYLLECGNCGYVADEPVYGIKPTQCPHCGVGGRSLGVEGVQHG